MHVPISFAINRISASRMPFAAFAAMARRLGVDTIEIRNDLAHVETRDGSAAADIGAIASAHGLTIRSINALQRFDRFDANRATEARALVRYAMDCGAQALVLCPTNDRADPRAPQQKQDDLLHALSQLRALLSDHGLLGLVETLGFEECALRHKSAARRAIEQIDGTACFALVHDTFHHRLAGEETLFAGLTGLVHISGVEDHSLPVERLRDPHRVLVGPADRIGNVQEGDRHSRPDARCHLVHGVRAQQHALGAARLEATGSIFQDGRGVLPAAFVLGAFDGSEIDAVHQQRRRAQRPQPLPHMLVDQPIVFGAGFPAHPADQSDGSHAEPFQARFSRSAGDRTGTQAIRASRRCAHPVKLRIGRAGSEGRVLLEAEPRTRRTITADASR